MPVIDKPVQVYTRHWLNITGGLDGVPKDGWGNSVVTASRQLPLVKPPEHQSYYAKPTTNLKGFDYTKTKKKSDAGYLDILKFYVFIFLAAIVFNLTRELLAFVF